MASSSGVNQAVAVLNLAKAAPTRWKAPRDRLVAGVDVALQLRIAVGEVLELADLVVGQVGLEQLCRAARGERALHRRERVHLRVHVLHAGFPGVPARVDRREVPAELGRDLGPVAGARLGGDRGGRDGGGAEDGGDCEVIFIG
jgi:hypothetical protein